MRVVPGKRRCRFHGGMLATAYQGGHDLYKAQTVVDEPSVGICASKAALCATGRARTAADTNAVHDRLLQSMRVRFSDSEQWCHQLSLRARKIM